jgi:hypothetical protein
MSDDQPPDPHLYCDEQTQEWKQILDSAFGPIKVIPRYTFLAPQIAPGARPLPERRRVRRQGTWPRSTRR